LELFAVLKGVEPGSVAAEADRLLREVGLAEKRHCLSSTLSGGMKRKLSVAMAFIGGSKTVFLDEPTSGMDPYSRRDTWALIQQYKQGRVIVLTTHFMDEADLLGDRIAIMTHGQLSCHGTSLFLKSRYGVGYTLTMVREDEAKFSADQTDSFVRKYVPSAGMLSSAGGEVSYQLPLQAVSGFAGLFAELESRRASMGIGGYGVSMTTLEDVFLKIADKEEQLKALEHAGADEEEKSKQQAKGREGSSEMAVEMQPVVIVGQDKGRADTTQDTSQGQAGVDDDGVVLVVGGGGEASKRPLPPSDAGDGNSAQGGGSGASGDDGQGLGFASVDICQTPPTDSVGTSLGARAASSSGSTMRQGSGFWVQLRELLKKRWVIGKRDPKGRFTEVALPVVIVGLVMLVLESNYTPAGPEVLLTFPLYKQDVSDELTSPYVEVLHSSVGGADPAAQDLASHIAGARVSSTEARTSQQMSELLLPQYYYHDFQATRCGAYIINDTYHNTIKTKLPDARSKFFPSAAAAADKPAAHSPTYRPYIRPTPPPSSASPTPWAPPAPAPPLTIQDLVVNGSMPLDIPSSLVIMHNSTQRHIIPILSAEYTAARLRVALANLTASSSSSSSRGAYYRVRNTPLPLTVMGELRIQTFLTMFMALFVLIPFSYLPATFSIFVVKERFIKAKHLQLVSGVHPTTYWVSHYLWDLANFFVVVVAVMVVFGLYGSKQFVGSTDNFFGSFLLLLAYGLAVIPQSYCYSFGFTSHTSAQVAITAFHFVAGFIMVCTSFILDVDKDTRDTNKTLKYFYRLFPPFNLGEGMISISTLEFEKLIDPSTTKNIFSYEVTGRTCLYLVSEAVAYFALVLAIEYSVVQRGVQWSGAGRVWRLVIRTYLRGKAWLSAKARCVRVPWPLGRSTRHGGSHALLSNSDTPLAPAPAPASASSSFAPSASSASASTDVAAAAAASLEPDGYAPVAASAGGDGGGRDDDEDSGGEEEFVELDSDVRAERDRVMSGAADDEVVVIKQLRKVYPPRGLNTKPVPAVKDLCLAIPTSQCFGFLGINGAGKTSTLQVLTGDHQPTSGTATVNGFDILTHMQDVRKEVGYCPQFDPLLDLMTAREHLTMYARLRGMTDAQQIHDKVSLLLEQLTLTMYADKPAGGYSGGNKRKLSLGLALIGDPSVLFLDEPSTGMDPVSRRCMWDIIQTVSKQRSVVLTTHSMEECEALCSRIGIMVNGTLRCLGSIQHLKSKFGGSYFLEINVRPGVGTEKVQDYVSSTFEGAVLEEHYGDRIKYQLPSQLDLSLSDLFGAVEQAKERLDIADYALSQTTLEQVFILMAKQQKHDPRQD